MWFLCRQDEAAEAELWKSDSHLHHVENLRGEIQRVVKEFLSATQMSSHTAAELFN